MATHPVIEYSANWDPVKNVGNIVVKAGDGPPRQLPINDAQEFIAFMLMLSKSGVVFNDVTNEFEIPMRPVGT